MDNDAARHELTEALALLQEHLADLAIVEEKRAALSATAAVAEGTVVVTVNSLGVVTNTSIDESYLDSYELSDLGDYVTAAAQAATRDVERQTTDLLAPLVERRARFPSLSDVVDGAPDVRELVPDLNHLDVALQFAADRDHGEVEAGSHPTVRSQR